VLAGVPHRSIGISLFLTLAINGCIRLFG